MHNKGVHMCIKCMSILDTWFGHPSSRLGTYITKGYVRVLWNLLWTSGFHSSFACNAQASNTKVIRWSLEQG